MTTQATGQSLPQTLPGNGTYNAARFTSARKELAATLAAPVFTDAERQTAAANAWACDSLYRLATWLRNVTRLAAERAVAAAKQRTADEQADFWRLRQPRYALVLLLGNAVFSPAERKTAITAAWACEDVTRLRRWLRNVARVVKDREDELWLAHELGFPTGPISPQHAAAAPDPQGFLPVDKNGPLTERLDVLAHNIGCLGRRFQDGQRRND